MLIGVSGYGQSGKNSTTAVLARDFGYEDRAFADPLKEALLRLNPIIGETDPDRLKDVVDEHGWEYAKKYPECRALLQRMGTEVGREMFGTNFWVEQGMRGVTGESLVAFSDVRFYSEADAIRAVGGKVIRINRKDHGPVNGHRSETELDSYPFDLVLYNDGTLEDLAKEVHRAVQSLREH